MHYLKCTAFLCWLLIDWTCIIGIKYRCIDKTTEKLNRRIRQLQVTKTKRAFPPFTWNKLRGLYESEVKLYFHGPPEEALLRHMFGVFDNNMFATSWITSCLLEVSRYRKGPQPMKKQLQLSVDAVSPFRDRNRNFSHSYMTFWPQVYNESTGSWQSTPQNLLDLFHLTDILPMNVLEDILKLLGFKNVERIVEHLMQSKSMFAQAFHIPSDFDDTFVNIGLGSLLAKLETDFPDIYKTWLAANTNVTSAFDALKKYAYRPLTNASRVNSIDPRTYFYLHPFLEKARSENKDVALVPTWIQDSDEVRKMFYKGVAMPFNINNVDVTVATNTIYGITAGILSGIVTPEMFDKEIQKIYLNTTSMIAFELSTNFSNRQDLALTYYPSKFECYWFGARIYSLLKTESRAGKLPFEALDTARKELRTPFQGAVTADIIQSAKTDSQGRIYYDDFMGDGDRSLSNQTEVRAEDRIFTTAMAINALITTWSTFDKERKLLVWDKDTPLKVKQVVEKAVAWLNDFVLSGQYKPWNAFFSGSGKGMESMPFWYPANRLEFFNGTRFHDDHFPKGNAQFIVGFEGVVGNDVYSEMLKRPHFGRMTPLDFVGFNNDAGFFPFWSSDAYTYASSMLALTKYRNIVDM